MNLIGFFAVCFLSLFFILIFGCVEIGLYLVLYAL